MTTTMKETADQDIVEWLRKKAKGFFKPTSTRLKEAADEIERLRNVVALLIEYEEHDKNILKGAVMWEALIEAAHRALMEKE